MPASKHGDVQNNRTDGRKFITIRVTRNEQTRHERVYLRTKDLAVARRRALSGVANRAEGCRTIAYLERSRSSDEELRRIAEVAKLGPVTRRGRAVRPAALLRLSRETPRPGSAAGVRTRHAIRCVAGTVLRGCVCTRGRAGRALSRTVLYENAALNGWSREAEGWHLNGAA
jgi:hypothetical protein